MQENHKKEQYFFDRPTLERLAGFLQGFERPLLLCCPMLGQFLWERGVTVPVLDIDERFAHLPGFIRWDVYRPTPIDVRPDLILIDPPFNLVRPDQLFAAVRVLTSTIAETRLMIANTPRGGVALMGTFATHELRPTGFKPKFVTVPDDIGIEFFGNVGEERLAPLLG